MADRGFFIGEEIEAKELLWGISFSYFYSYEILLRLLFLFVRSVDISGG